MFPLSDILLTAWHIIEIPLVLYALWHGTQQVREIIADLWGIKHHAKYRVKRTYIKDIIREDHTERIKLRQLRVSENMRTLSIDTAPYVVETGARIKVSSLFAIPGRADLSPDRKIVIQFLDNEELKRFRDRSVVLGYTMNETLGRLYDPPGVLAKQPVGKDCLVYEAHFPKDRYYERADGNSNKPKLRVYTKDPNDPLDPMKYHVDESFPFDFGDGLGPVDWLRISIPRPPQDDDIHIEWTWKNGQVTKVMGSS